MRKVEILEAEIAANLRTFVEDLNTQGHAYSVRRAILSLADSNFGNCLEREVSAEIGKRLGGQTPRGLFLPLGLRLPETRTLSTTAGAGGQFIFTQAGSLIEMLRAALVTGRLGATVLDQLQGPLLFPKQSGAGTLTWTAETPGSDVADTDLTTGCVTMSPKSAISTTAFSRQLLTQSSLDVEALVRADLVAVNAQGIDKAAIQGTGTLQPLGIIKQSGIGDVPIGTDGGYPNYGLLIDLETKLFNANIHLTKPGLLTTPGVRGYLKQTPKIAGFPEYIWRPEDLEILDSLPCLVSNNVPSTLTKGTKNDCHAIIIGNWPDLIIGLWGVIEIIVDPYRLKKQAVIEVTSFVMVDVALRYPVAFAAILDARIVA
jgi:HK97 family phage major capsid protein